MYFRLIGDIHCARPVYRKYIQDVPYSLQVGDFDEDYDWLVEEKIDLSRHRFIAGNHDDYDKAPKSPYCLGDYGTHSIPGFGAVFFVRGAWSIDHKYRRPNPIYSRGVLFPKNYWPDKEELDYATGQKALELYKLVKPKFVVAHECPLSVVQHVTDPNFVFDFGYSEPVIKTRTNQLLQAMVDFHRPHTFAFGHFHRDFDQVIDGTRFICVDLSGKMDFTKDYLSAD